MKILLKSGVYHGIATHDEKMIESTIRFAKAESIPASAFEFQMLYGIRRDLQRELVKQGYGMRVYIPFGAEWYPYLMRRLAERPALGSARCHRTETSRLWPAMEPLDIPEMEVQRPGRSSAHSSIGPWRSPLSPRQGPERELAAAT